MGRQARSLGLKISSPYVGGMMPVRNRKIGPYHEPKSQALPLAERPILRGTCSKCGSEIQFVRRQSATDHGVMSTCARCRRRILALYAENWKKKYGDIEERKARSYVVRCLRCSWTGKVASRYGAFVCGKDPRHPVVAE